MFRRSSSAVATSREGHRLPRSGRKLGRCRPYGNKHLRLEKAGLHGNGRAAIAGARRRCALKWQTNSKTGDYFVHPIEQFEIVTLFPIAKIGNVEIAFTNSA